MLRTRLAILFFLFRSWFAHAFAVDAPLTVIGAGLIRRAFGLVHTNAILTNLANLAVTLLRARPGVFVRTTCRQACAHHNRYKNEVFHRNSLLRESLREAASIVEAATNRAASMARKRRRNR